MSLLDLEMVSQTYPVAGSGRWLKPPETLIAVNQITLSLNAGETLAVVGESGCGKSTLGRVVSLLERPKSGTVTINGERVDQLSAKDLNTLRKQLGLVFQDPYTALNPRLPVSELIAEPLQVHQFGDRQARQERVREVLSSVGLDETVLNRYPHEFSGGQRQRICIARALVLEPKLIIADEPLSALDVSVQSQILNLFADLKREREISFFFISHDLAVVDYLADHIAVMYLGQIVEYASKDEFFEHAAHPYSCALLAAVPKLGHGRRDKGLALQGDVPSPIDPPKGCPFHPRCHKAQDLCRIRKPSIEQLDGESHWVRCHYPEIQKMDAGIPTQVVLS